MNIKIEELGPDNPDALGLLAWHELVETAEKTLPILVLGNGDILTDGQIRSYLEGLSGITGKGHHGG